MYLSRHGAYVEICRVLPNLIVTCYKNKEVFSRASMGCVDCVRLSRLPADFELSSNLTSTSSQWQALTEKACCGTDSAELRVPFWDGVPRCEFDLRSLEHATTMRGGLRDEL